MLRTSMSVSQDLSMLWRKTLAAEKAVSRFAPTHADENGRWQSGDTLRAGLKIDEHGEAGYFMFNETRHQSMDPIIEREQIGPFVKEFVEIRRMRPNFQDKEKQVGRQPAPAQGAASCGFKCAPQDRNHEWSLYRREPLCIFEGDRKWLVAYPNLAPFEPNGHAIWVPGQLDLSDYRLELPHEAQQMTPDLLAAGLALFDASQNQLFFYNSIHAGASQDHFHWQSIFLPDSATYAIEHAPAVASDGSFKWLVDYPIEALVFDRAQPPSDIWACLHALIENGIPHNIILLRHRIYAIPRNPIHEVVDEFRFGILASMEMAGRLILSRREDFLATGANEVRSALRQSGLSRQEIKALLT